MTDAIETDHDVLAERLKIIRLKQAGIDEAAKVVADLKDRLKAAKEMWESRVIDLGDFIRDGSLPLFDATSDQPLATASPDGSAVSDQQPDESWRTIHLNELTDPGISPATLAKLANAGIETIGEMADKTASDRFDLTDIHGIGAKAAGDIEDALAAFWSRWKNQQATESYRATIGEIPASEIKLPKGKDFFDYYCAAELAAATDDEPAEVKAFKHDRGLYTITAGNGNEDGAKTAEAWKLEPLDEYHAPTRNAGPHPAYDWLGYEGRIVIVKNERRVMTDQARIVLEDRD